MIKKSSSNIVDDGDEKLVKSDLRRQCSERSPSTMGASPLPGVWNRKKSIFNGFMFGGRNLTLPCRFSPTSLNENVQPEK